ncbi:MAG TPA: deoxyribose-phosphate aldolase [Planctomycetota bacterium]
MGSTAERGGAAELAAAIDHTLLAPTATAADVERLCDEARAHGFASVCVNGVHVARCRARLAGSAVRVACVVGFPLGADAPGAKRRAAEIALADGAEELDVVLQLGALRAGDHALVEHDLAGVVAAARAAGGLVKAILETGLLDAEETRRACRIAEASGASFVKTSTGFGPRGATRADVLLLRQCVGLRLGVKASGGIKSAALARELLAAGATRLGTSASLAILREALQDEPG